MRFFTARTVGEQTYVYAGNPSAVLACTVDARGALIRYGWGGSSFGPGLHAEREPAGQVNVLTRCPVRTSL